MVHLRNGTPEYRIEYHLLLSDLIPFDQNNCHLHRYHQFCHPHWHHCGSPSQRSCSGFTWIRFLGQIKRESLHLCKSLTDFPHSNHHIHCLNATKMFVCCSDCPAFYQEADPALRPNMDIWLVCLPKRVAKWVEILYKGKWEVQIWFLLELSRWHALNHFITTVKLMCNEKERELF